MPPLGDGKVGRSSAARSAPPCSRNPFSWRKRVSAFCFPLSGYNHPTMPTRTNEEWLADLQSDGPSRDAALEDLRAVITKGLPYALSRWVSPSEPQFEFLVEEVTQESLLRILNRLNTFEGRSQFTTWAHKIAIRIALSELRRKRWRDSSLDELVDDEEAPAPESLLEDSSAGPEISVEREDMMVRVRRIIAEELTDRQREALLLLSVQDMPMEEAAKKLKTNRNALYKLLHDARLRLKRRLTLEGLSAQEVLTAFEQG
ncbi:MAG: sigma-70 family RNA polymerase sigma factor [Anaerolineaceae bacterium]|nr:MAG: sigma-70 family RNA polymerase sigma factor [Anaerolineaceae bacterium]